MEGSGVLRFTVMGKIKEWFEEQGLTAADFPKFMIVHEAIGIGFAVFMWQVRRSCFFTCQDIVVALVAIYT